MTKLKHKKRICLKYNANCNILAVSQVGEIYAEEYYDESFIAQYCIAKSGDIVTSHDEEHGNKTITPFSIDDTWQQPYRPQDHLLNKTGFRLRGMREADKVAEWVQPIPMLEKMPLLQQLNLSVPPMMVMGIAESRVLSEVMLSETTSLLCRQIRLLIALAEPQIDADGLPYDYETYRFGVVQRFDYEEELANPIHSALQEFPELTNPTDCLLVNDMLIVANSGLDDEKSSVHLYHLDD